MRPAVVVALALAPLILPLRAQQQEPQIFHGTIKYLGGIGFPDFKGHETWDNLMTITTDSVLMGFNDTNIAPRSFPVGLITRLEYGQAATRHVGRWVAVGILVAPIALLGIVHKQRHHYVTISYADSGQDRGVFFEANKDIVRNLLNTLSFRSKMPIYADAEDRKWLITQGVLAQADPDAKSDDKKK